MRLSLTPIHSGVAALCVALTSTAITHAGEFRWNWRASKRLDRNHTLRRARIPKAQRAELADVIANQLRPEPPSFGGPTEEELMEIALNTPVRFVHLNRDDIPEVIAQGHNDESGCSPTGNCPLWIFQRTARGYKLLLDATSQSFIIGRNRTNDYRDIVVAMHDSAFITDLKVYKYRDGAYDGVACCVADSQSPEGEELKEPLVTPCHR